MKKRIILLTCCLLLAVSGCRNQRTEGEEKEQENQKSQEENQEQENQKSQEENQEQENQKSQEENQEQPEETKTEKEIPSDEELSLQENSETHIEVSDYFQNFQQLVDILGMEHTEGWQLSDTDSYKKDNFYLEWLDDAFSMKDEGTDYVSLYGITVGDDMTEADTAMKENGWITYYTNENTSAYLTTINDRAFMASFDGNEEGKVTLWYLNNWPQGEDIYEVLNGQATAEESGDTQETPDVSSEWKQAYIDYINSHGQFEISKLVNINNDEIPELYINFGTTASGDVLCSYAEGTVIEQPMYNYGFSYIEGQNLFRDLGGHMDVYYDKIYTIQDGQFAMLYSGDYGAEDNSNVQLDESGMPIYNYYWNGTQVSSQEEYMTLLNQVYNTEQAITPYDGAQYEDGRYVGNGLCDYNEIIEAINNY